MRCGVSIAEYEEITPRELTFIIEMHQTKRQQDRTDMITQAYLTAAWQRAKKMPSLKKALEITKPKETNRAQTPEEMLAIAKRMHAEITKEEG